MLLEKGIPAVRVVDFEGFGFAGGGGLKSQFGGAKSHPIRTRGRTPIFRISHDWVAGGGELGADLVESSGNKLNP